MFLDGPFYKESRLIGYLRSRSIFLGWSHWVAIIVPLKVWKLHSWSLRTWLIGRGIFNLSIGVRHWNFWRYLGEVNGQGIITLGHSRSSLPKLASIALYLLSNQHSNAAEEHTSGLHKLLARLRPCTVVILKDLKIFLKRNVIW